MNVPMHSNARNVKSFLSRSWKRHVDFWTEPVDATAAAVIRIFLGLFSVQHALLIIPFSADFFGGSNPTISFQSATATQLQPVFSLFYFFPTASQLDFAAAAIPVVELIAGVLVALGLFTRVSLIVLYLMLVSMVERNNQITYGADIYQIAVVLFLLLSNSAGRLSLDALRAQKRRQSNNTKNVAGHGDVSESDAMTLPVGRNLMRFHLLFVYVQALLTKAVHQSWQDGTALWYVLHNENFQLLPFPAPLLTFEMSKFLTYSTLMLESSLLIGLFFRKIRYPLVLAGMVFHMAMDVFLNIPLFQWFIVTSYIAWFDEKDVRKVVEKLTAQVSRSSLTALLPGLRK